MPLLVPRMPLRTLGGGIGVGDKAMKMEQLSFIQKEISREDVIEGIAGGVFRYLCIQDKKPKTLEELMELALDVSTANGLLRVLVYSGKSYEREQGDYQAAVQKLRECLREMFLQNFC